GHDLINGQGVARADTKQRDGPEVPLRNPDKEQQSKRENWKPTNFPPGVGDKDEQDQGENRKETSKTKTKMVDANVVKKVLRKIFKKDKKPPAGGKAVPLRLVLDSSGITPAGTEPGKAVDIQGEIPFEPNANAKYVDA